MHIDHLSIASVPADNGRDHYQGVPAGKVAYTPLILRTVSCLCNEVEFQGVCEREEEEQEGHLDQGSHGRRDGSTLSRRESP